MGTTTIQILDHMESLRLKGMHSKFTHILNSKNLFSDEDITTVLGALLEAEIIARDQRSQELLFKNAKLKQYVHPSKIECSPTYGLSKLKWQQLCEGHYLKDKTNLVITGKVGVGKTHIALSLGYQACATKHKTRFYNMNTLIEEIRSARLQGTYPKLINQLTKVALLIIDDFALVSPEEDILVTLYDIIEARNGIGSTIFTSVLPFDRWYNLFQVNLNLGESFLDRLQGSSEYLVLAGASKRKKLNITNPDEE